MTLSLQLVLSGIAAGGVYGLVAVGHSVVFRLTGIVHFALGDLIGVAVFATLLVASGTGPVATTDASTPRFLLALAVGLAAAVLVGAGGYVFAVQPYLRGRSAIGWVVAVVALAFALHALISAVFERPAYVFPDPLRLDGVGEQGRVSIAGASFHVRSLVVVALALILVALSIWTLERTWFGRALRAIADDREAALFCGLPVERFVTIAFGVAGAIAALAAIAAAPSAPIDVNTGTLLGVKGLAAAAAVGFGSPLRSFAAGIVLGLGESGIAGIDALGVEWRDVLPLAAATLLILRVRRRSAEVFE